MYTHTKTGLQLLESVGGHAVALQVKEIRGKIDLRKLRKSLTGKEDLVRLAGRKAIAAQNWERKGNADL